MNDGSHTIHWCQVFWVSYDWPDRWKVNTVVAMEDLLLMGCDVMSSDQKILFLGLRGPTRFMFCGLPEIRMP
jgi:hypothetical protein